MVTLGDLPMTCVRPNAPADEPATLETTTVKLLLSVAALAGSLGLLLSDWAGQAFPYL